MPMSLKALRINANLTRPQVVEATKIPENTLANYENFTTKVPIDRAIQLAEFYGCSVDDIRWTEE